MAKKWPSKIVHRGIHYRRVTSGYDPREKAFADEWEKENDPTWRTPVLLALCHAARRKGDGLPGYIWYGPLRFLLRNREAALVATVVQWLGSNCGMDFLRQALKRCGYDIVKRDGP